MEKLIKCSKIEYEVDSLTCAKMWEILQAEFPELKPIDIMRSALRLLVGHIKWNEKCEEYIKQNFQHLLEKGKINGTWLEE